VSTTQQAPPDTEAARAAKIRHQRIARAWRTVWFIVLALGGISFMMPLAWMISTSFKAEGAIFTYPPQWIPRRQLTAWGPDIVPLGGEWGRLFEGEVQGVAAVVAIGPTGPTSEGGTVPAEIVEPVARKGEWVGLPWDWPDSAQARGGAKKLFWAATESGERLKVIELQNIEDGKVAQIVEPPSREGEIVALPLYRADAKGKLRPVFEAIREVYFKPGNYPDAWNALKLRRGWLAFYLPYALRFDLGGKTYQIGPPRFEGFQIKSAFAAFYLNSIIVAICVTAGQVLTSSLAGYAFARLHFPGRDKLFLGYLGTLMVPYVVTMIPVFILLRFMHLIDTYAALILPGIFSAYGTFMLRQFFLTIPTELEDAARIDGCSKWGIYTNVILPLSKPALATLTTFVFLGNWNSFMWPLIVISSPEKKTLPIGLYAFMGQYNTEWTLLMAASLMVMAPVLLVFILGQRYFVKGIVLSGLKG
jgi:multiple sugar transport system permease protein